MRHSFQNAAPQDPDTAATAKQASAPSSATRRLRIALGTWVAIEATHAGRRGGPASENADPASARESTLAAAGARTSAAELDAINAAYAAITEVDARMHPTRRGSDLALINSTAPGTPIEVHPDTWRLLQLARRIYDLTDGVFDPCIPMRPGRLRDIEINPDMPMLTCHVPVQLDLGGIAKGRAIDRAVATLLEYGCTSGLVNAGGDVRVFGDHTETILLRQRAPSESGDIYRPVELNNAALAVSDLDAAGRPQEHQGYYNRSTGETATRRRYAAVLANNATTADALTKCLLLCPAAATERVLREFAAHAINMA